MSSTRATSSYTVRFRSRRGIVMMCWRVKQGGTDEEILEWCFEKGRPLNEGDLFVWNGFASKLGWRDSISPRLEERKKEMGIADRDDIQCIPDLIDFDEGRFPQAAKSP